MEKEAVLTVSDLSLYYGKKKALNTINMTFYKNEITALIGPSGCGKSTLLSIGLESDDYILVGKISKLNRKSIVLNKIDEQTNFIQSQRIPFSKIRLIEYKNNYLTSLSKYENLFASID